MAVNLWDELAGVSKPLLGILASPKMRDSSRPKHLTRFVRDYHDVLQNYHLVVTRGTFTDVFAREDSRATLAAVNATERIAWSEFRGDEWAALDGTVLRRGKDGGLVTLSSLLLPNQRRTDDERRRAVRCGTVIHLMHPDDKEDQYPEIRQLIRMSAVGNATLLLTYRSAELWASNEAQGGSRRVPVREPDDRLALIAHDGRKLPMLKFVVEFRNQLELFENVITTGTTGGHVESVLQLLGLTSPQVLPYESGPKGGDAEISTVIIEGGCHHVCFFIDPDSAHAHEADVFALLRACAFEGCDVNLRLSPSAGASWLQSLDIGVPHAITDAIAGGLVMLGDHKGVEV